MIRKPFKVAFFSMKLYHSKVLKENWLVQDKRFSNGREKLKTWELKRDN